MPDTNEMSQYIKLKECRDGDTLKFMDGGQLVEKEFDQKDGTKNTATLLEITASLNGGKSKTVSLSSPHISELKKVWGANSDEWVGKTSVVRLIWAMSWGEKKQVPFLEPEGAQAGAAPQPQEAKPEPTEPASPNGGWAE